MSQWIRIGPNTDKIQDVLRQTADALDTIVDVLRAIRAIIDAIAALLIAFESLIKALLIAVITLIEQLILNLLEQGIHLALHSNLKYDKDWTWKPKQLPDGSTSPNFKDGDVPFDGTGVSGWLAEVSASTYDHANFFRPVTDSQSQVAGVIILLSGPTFNEAKDLIPIFNKVFKNWDAFRISPKGYEEVEGKNKWMTALKGYWGSRVKTLSEGSAEIAASMEEMQDSLGDRYSDALPDLPDALLNSPGPAWVGTPLAALFGDPVEQMADLLRDFINSFTFADSPIIQLLNAISEKIAQIERLITKISDIIDALAALLEMLELSSIYAAVETEGGAAAFFANAATAKGVPNVGPNGFGIGAVGMLTSPSAASFESLFELFGADVKNAISGVGSAVQQIDRAADDVVRESEDVGEAFSGIEYD